METVQKVLGMATQWRKDTQMWERIGGSSLQPNLDKLDKLMPKIVVGGNQNCGKSSLLNKLMPQAIQGSIKLVERDGCCTRSVTTIQFVKGDAAQVSVVCKGEQNTCAWDSKASVWLQEQLDRIAALEAQEDTFFKYPLTIELKHPKIDTNYTLMDTPGMFASETSVKAEVGKLVTESHLYLAAGVAADDLVAFSSLEVAPKSGSVCRGDTTHTTTKTILVATKSDGVTNPEVMGSRVAELEQKFPHLHKWAFTAAVFPNELEILNEKLSYLPSSARKILGTNSLRSEVQGVYRRLVEDNLHEATTIAGELRDKLRSTIDSLEAALRMHANPAEVVGKSFHEVIQPQFLEQNGELEMLVQKFQEELEGSWRNEWIDDFIEKNPTFLERVMEDTSCNDNGMIGGSGGIYPYLKTAYGFIARALLEGKGSVLRKLEGKFNEIKKAATDRLMKACRTQPHYRKLMENYSTHVGYVKSDPTERLTAQLYRAPTTAIPYGHNWYAAEVHKELNLMLNAFHVTLLEGQKSGVPVDPSEFMMLKVPLDKLAAVKDNTHDVRVENVTQFIKWYWNTTFRNQLIEEQKQYLNELKVNVQEALKNCHYEMAGNADKFAVQADQKVPEMLKKVKVAYSELCQILPSSHGRVIQPAVARPPLAAQTSWSKFDNDFNCD